MFYTIGKDTVTFSFDTGSDEVLFKLALDDFLLAMLNPLLGPPEFNKNDTKVEVSFKVLASGNIAYTGISRFCQAILQKYCMSFFHLLPKVFIHFNYRAKPDLFDGSVVVHNFMFVWAEYVSGSIRDTYTSRISKYLSDLIPAHVVKSSVIIARGNVQRFRVITQSGKGFDRLDVLESLFSSLI
jgi:hypothetical protein